jgi:hypothetical protein
LVEGYGGTRKAFLVPIISIFGIYIATCGARKLSADAMILSGFSSTSKYYVG